MSLIILSSLILVVCYANVVFPKSVHQEKYGGRIPGCCRRTFFEYDVCEFPKENQEEDDSGSSMYTDDELQEVSAISKKEIYDIKRLMKKTERKIRCNRQLQILKGKELKDLVDIRTLTNEGYNITSVITTTYIKISKVTRLLGHLKSTLLNSAQECCLHYPNEIVQRLENRVLMKWYYIQKGFGDSIDISKCNVNIQVEIKEPMGCDNTRDIIYLLLKEIMNVLKESKKNIPKTRRK